MATRSFIQFGAYMGVLLQHELQKTASDNTNGPAKLIYA
jgi:hypothetical protein